MNEVISSTTTTTDHRQFKPRSILRNSKSSPILNSNKNSSATISGSAKSKLPILKHKPGAGGAGSSSNKFSSVVHKFVASCNNFLEKLRSISDEVFSVDETIKEYFVSSDGDDSRLEKITKSNRGYTSAEERFIEEFKAAKSLEVMYQGRRQQKAADQRLDNSTPPPVPPKLKLKMPTEHRVSLQDVIRQTSGEGDSSSTLNLSYHDLDVCEMRKEFEVSPPLESTSTASPLSSSASETSSSPCPPTEINIGETLWNYRRTKWLHTDKTAEELEDRISCNQIEELPQELQVKIYTNLVNKGKVLKKDKELNLQDLVVIINAGWEAEDKWERAAKGLA